MQVSLIGDAPSQMTLVRHFLFGEDGPLRGVEYESPLLFFVGSEENDLITSDDL
jgi:hypothetical protein